MATIPLTITIRDFVYRSNITVPDVVQLPIKLPTTLPTTPPVTPSIQPPVTPPTAPSGTRIVTILPAGERKLPDANEGETIKITATAICKTGDTITKPRDTAYLIIDGAVVDNKPLENGTVTFEWTATAIPISTHTICVNVRPSSECKSPGQDCKRINVSPIRLGSAEQLSKERATAKEQKRLLEQARQGLRESIIGAELPEPIPGGGFTQPSIQPSEIVIPTTPTAPPVTKPAEPQFGSIEITDIPIPITPAIPVYLNIDDKQFGRINTVPYTASGVPTGFHSVYITAGDFSSPIKTVTVNKDATSKLSMI